MELLLVGIFIILFILVANWLDNRENRTLHLAFDIGLLLLQLPLIGFGAVLALLPAEQALLFQENGLALQNLRGAGLAFALMGVWGLMIALRPLRRLLARLLPQLRPASAVHTVALLLSGYLIGNTALTLTQGGLEALADTAVSASIFDVVIQQMLFVALAFLGVGLFIRRNDSDVRSRLNLQRPTRAQIRPIIGWIVLLVLAQGAIGGLWQALQPEQAELLGGLNESLLADFDTVWEWLALGVASGLGEELLFRGALQPIFGLVPTSILFAIAHVQYGFTPITLVVFVLGFALGYIRNRYNTTVAILVHGGYNFTLGLLSLIAASLIS